MSNEINELPDELIPQGVKKQALDIKFHWVNQTGEVAKMTAGLLVQPTVSPVTKILHSSFLTFPGQL